MININTVIHDAYTYTYCMMLLSLLQEVFIAVGDTEPSANHWFIVRGIVTHEVML